MVAVLHGAAGATGLVTHLAVWSHRTYKPPSHSTRLLPSTPSGAATAPAAAACAANGLSLSMVKQRQRPPPLAAAASAAASAAGGAQPVVWSAGLALVAYLATYSASCSCRMSSRAARRASAAAVVARYWRASRTSLAPCVLAYGAPLLPRSTGNTGDARRGERVGLETQREHKPNTMCARRSKKARWRVPCQQVVPSTVTIKHVSFRGAAFPRINQNFRRIFLKTTEWPRLLSSVVFRTMAADAPSSEHGGGAVAAREIQVNTPQSTARREPGKPLAGAQRAPGVE